jgi:hypothetical protein
MMLGYWLRHPQKIIPRLRYWWWERHNRDKPWLTRGAIEFCEQHLTRQMRGLEFGSGRSTAWFARRLKQLTSIEYSRQWHQAVREQLHQQEVVNADCRHIELDHPRHEPERASYDPLPRYVQVIDEFADSSLDLIIIDGHYRTTCIRHVLSKVRSGGFLLIDDLGYWPDDPPVPGDWQLVSRSGNGIKETGIWQKPVG